MNYVRPPDDAAIQALRRKIERRWSFWRGLRSGFIYAIALYAIVGMAFFLAGCASTPCNTCLGPYDLSLSSHREALR